MNRNKKKVFCAYETNTGTEQCIAVADSRAELADMLGINLRALDKRIERTKNGIESYDYTVMPVEIDLDDDDENS